MDAVDVVLAAGLATLKDYNPDQPRDERGRFGEGGGGGASESRGTGGRSQAVSEDEYFDPHGEFVERIRKAEDAFSAGKEQALRALELAEGMTPDDIPIDPNSEKDQAIGAKMMVASNLAEATGLPEGVCRGLVRGWAQTSNDNDLRAMFMQKMASEEFGAPLSDWQQDKLMKLERQRTAFEVDELEMPERYMTPFEGIEDQLGGMTQEEAARSFLRAQYNATQEFFKEQGIEQLVLFRGQQGDPSKGGDGATNAMESWSIDDEVAQSFTGSITSEGGYIEAAVFPVDRILSTPFTGYGCLNEGEVVVLGGPGDSLVIGGGE